MVGAGFIVVVGALVVEAVVACAVVLAVVLVFIAGLTVALSPVALLLLDSLVASATPDDIVVLIPSSPTSLADTASLTGADSIPPPPPQAVTLISNTKKHQIDNHLGTSSPPSQLIKLFTRLIP